MPSPCDTLPEHDMYLCIVSNRLSTSTSFFSYSLCAQCFDVEPEFHRGSWILLFCAVSSFASTLSILRLSHSAVSERNGLKHTHVERSSAVAVNGDDQDEIAVAAAAAAAATSTHANEPTTQSLSFSLRVLVASGMVVFEASN
eukprot:m.147134 g.147134  ORF g.147134 m.147134 type:complete len:143 (-) comp14160_c0_seq11:576-1004(-)